VEHKRRSANAPKSAAELDLRPGEASSAYFADENGNEVCLTTVAIPAMALSMPNGESSAISIRTRPTMC
jgi:hypothetical protein